VYSASTVLGADSGDPISSMKMSNLIGESIQIKVPLKQSNDSSSSKLPNSECLISTGALYFLSAAFSSISSDLRY
jgi:hypothetical protein